MTTTYKPDVHRKLHTRSHVAGLVVLILVMHWSCMHMLATRWMRESQLAFAQARDTNQDRWRHTAAGWEILPVADQQPLVFTTPSQHVSLAQTWPAAWAACLALAIIALATD